MLTLMLAYEPAGTVAEVPRNAESLCSLVRSTPKVVAFSGMFTLDPLDGVSVIVLTSTMKERRLVFGGGVSGAAVIVKLRLAEPPPPPPPPGVFKPPHEVRKIADTKSGAAKIFPTFMQPPRQSVCFA